MAKLTFENYEHKYIWEAPNEDVSIHDLVDTFVGILRSATYTDYSIYTALKTKSDEIFQNADDIINLKD